MAERLPVAWVAAAIRSRDAELIGPYRHESLTRRGRRRIQLITASASGPRATPRLAYVAGIEDLADCIFELEVDEAPTTLSFSGGVLVQEPGRATAPEIKVRTTSRFLERWAAGEVDWDDGLADGEVTTEGPAEAWSRWLAATGYVLQYEPEDAGARVA
jgi:hypothetical protein